MDKLTPSQMQSLLRSLQSATLAQTKGLHESKASDAAHATGTANATAARALGAVQLNTPAALRQIVAQAQSPLPLLQSMAALRGSGAELPPQVRSVVESMFASAQSPRVTPALISQWFGLNPVLGLTQPSLAGAGGAANAQASSALWLQQALPLLLLLLRPQGDRPAPSQPLQQALSQLFGGLFTSGANSAMQQFLRDLQGNLQQARLSQMHYAESASRQEPDYYLTLPWLVDKNPSAIELLIQRRKQQREREQQSDGWVLSMRLNITKIGPILARVRWTGSDAGIQIYTDNDAASRWLTPKVTHLEQQLSAQGIVVKELAVQTGRIPATLAPDPNQLIRVRV
ncbi:flagellar hook-length control protein FliK [Aliidiomarina celeris]|uniref:flagellar hook-length control protein FliK n=1 Tax=Aliidiomarina celeris TaxID=2249428 RepID=UPI000DEB77CE|nr:flagellar hook-length control protein FliK [Aliidiomarina celeris]